MPSLTDIAHFALIGLSWAAAFYLGCKVNWWATHHHH